MLLPQWNPWVWLAIITASLILGGYLLMKLLRYEMRAVARRITRGRELDSTVRQWVEELARAIRPVLMFTILVLIVYFTLRALGRAGAAEWSPGLLTDWLVGRGLRIALVLACAYLVIRFMRLLVTQAGRLVPAQEQGVGAEIERQKRAQTITSILERLSTVVIVIVTVTMLLSELGVNTAPILTGLGVIGVGLGFGAQQLVGDVIAGFFHIFENQIRVGDVATINGTSGLVQELGLRTTVLRGFDGSVHVFRNGTIQTLTNMTKDFSYFVLDVAVSYHEDPDRVARLLQEIAAELQAEPEYGSVMLAPVEVFSVENFSETTLLIKMRIKTLPSKQWDIGREFRRRLKQRFEAEHISLPTQPVMTIARQRLPKGGRSSSQTQ
jgi:small conductance mechanosensitive channel